MEKKLLKTGEAVDMAIAHYGFETKELALALYEHGGPRESSGNPEAKLKKLLKKWLKESLSSLPYDDKESVWDHYAKHEEKYGSDRLLPKFVVQQWYMELDRDKFKRLFERIGETPKSLEETQGAIERENERINKSEMEKNRDFDYGTAKDYAQEVEEVLRIAAKSELERKKIECLWNNYLDENGYIFGEEQERAFIEDFCIKDIMHDNGDYGAMYQELTKKLSDINNYCKEEKWNG